jgi:hypothetical protein
MLLGDSCLAFSTPNSKHARMQFQQANESFTYHLYNKMSILLETKPKLIL